MKFLLLAVALIALFDLVSSFKISNKPIGLVNRSLQIPSLKKTITQPRISTELHAIIPGSPMVVGTIAQGLANSVSFFSNVILARYIL